MAYRLLARGQLCLLQRPLTWDGGQWEAGVAMSGEDHVRSTHFYRSSGLLLFYATVKTGNRKSAIDRWVGLLELEGAKLLWSRMLAMARPIWKLWFIVNSRLIICQTISSDMVGGLGSSREFRFGNQTGVKRYPARAASLKP